MIRRSLSILFFALLVLASQGAYAKEVETTPNYDKVMDVLTRIKSPMLGKNAVVHFDRTAHRRLDDYADSILSKLAFQKEKNIFHVSNPNLHRMICFFVTNFVYATEAKNFPKNLQVYLVYEDEKGVVRDKNVSLDIQNMQDVFNRCEKLELKFVRSKFVYFTWDDSNYLNSVIVEVAQAEAEAKSKRVVPKVFQNDPLLSSIYKTAELTTVRMGTMERIFSEVGDTTVNQLLKGCRYEIGQLEGQEDIDMGHVAGKLLKRTGKKIGKKIVQKFWKRRQTIQQSFAKDDSELLTGEHTQAEIARQLTNLIAAPNRPAVTGDGFTKILKSIFGNDAKIKLKMGGKKVYAGYSINFE